MKNEKEIKEPYRPEDTPNPPQIIDPNRPNNEAGDKGPVKAERKSPAKQSDKKETKPDDDSTSEKRLGESESEITDETTI